MDTETPAASVCGGCGAECDEDVLYCWSCGRPLRPEAEEEAEYAGFWRRFGAYVADAIICLAGMACIAAPLTVLLGLPSVSGFPTDPRKGFFFMKVFLAAGIASKVMAWLYYTIAESSGWGATPGKRIFGLRVTTLEGDRISFWQANKRYWSKLASDVLYLGYISILVTERRQALHDFLSKTVVVRHRGS